MREALLPVHFLPIRGYPLAAQTRQPPSTTVHNCIPTRHRSSTHSEWYNLHHLIRVENPQATLFNTNSERYINPPHLQHGFRMMKMIATPPLTYHRTIQAQD
ncbi:hypothetical protein T02_1313 [Trichinella nativa]|uniref:Uncharacterized protein n=1 Tax=Trichinella nativa TaxID=6335 RepID=A0A0V1KMW5_9BILA|nr:hypothetical protein T02_1313 [Trichinella nativa]